MFCSDCWGDRSLLGCSFSSGWTLFADDEQLPRVHKNTGAVESAVQKWCWVFPSLWPGDQWLICPEYNHVTTLAVTRLLTFPSQELDRLPLTRCVSKATWVLLPQRWSCGGQVNHESMYQLDSRVTSQSNHADCTAFRKSDFAISMYCHLVHNKQLCYSIIADHSLSRLCGTASMLSGYSYALLRLASWRACCLEL